MSENDREGRTFYERDPAKSYLNPHDPANIIPGDVRLRSQRNTTPFPEAQPIRKLSLPRDFESVLDTDPAIVEVNEIAAVAKDLDELTTGDIWKHIDGTGTTNLDELRQLWNDAMEEPVVGLQLAHLRELNPDHVAKYLRQRQWSLESAGLQDGRMSMAFGRNAETETGSAEGRRTSGAQYDLAIHPEISRFGRLQTIYEQNGEAVPSYIRLPPVSSPEFNARLNEFRLSIERRKSRGHPPPGITSESDARTTKPTVDAQKESPEVIDVERNECQKNAGAQTNEAETVVFTSGTVTKPPEAQSTVAKTNEADVPELAPTTTASTGQDQNLLLMIVQQLADAKTQNQQRAQDLHDQIKASNDTMTNRIDTNNRVLTDRMEANKQVVTGQIESNRQGLKVQLDAHGAKITKQFEIVSGRVDTIAGQVETIGSQVGTLQDEVRHNQDQAQSATDNLRQDVNTLYKDQTVFDQNVRTLADDLRTMRGELRKLTHGQTALRQTDTEPRHRYGPAVAGEHRSYQEEQEEVEMELPKPTRPARATPLPSAPVSALAQDRPTTNLLHLRTELTRQTGPFNPKAENMPGGFQTFEIKFRDMAEDLEVPPVEWIKILKTTLKGEAYTEYHAMPEHLKLNFDAVCQRLRTIYPAQPKNQMAARQDWAKLRQGNRQSIAEFVGKIESLAPRVFQETSAEGIETEKMLKFRAGLRDPENPNLTAQIAGIKSNTLSHLHQETEAIRLNLTQSHPHYDTSWVAVDSNEQGHNGDEAGKQNLFTSLRSQGPAYGKDRSEPNGGNYRSREERPRTETRTCYNCNKPGHIRRDCKEPPREKSGTKTFSNTTRSPTNYRGGQGGYNTDRNRTGTYGKCYNCGEPGHFSRQCPLKNSGTGANTVALGSGTAEQGLAHGNQNLPSTSDAKKIEDLTRQNKALTEVLHSTTARQNHTSSYAQQAPFPVASPAVATSNMATTDAQDRGRLPRPVPPQAPTQETEAAVQTFLSVGNNDACGTASVIGPKRPPTDNEQYMWMGKDEVPEESFSKYPKAVFIPVHVYQMEFMAMMDSGATITAVSLRLAKLMYEMGLARPYKEKTRISTFGGGNVVLENKIELMIGTEKQLKPIVCLVCPKLPTEIILGHNYMTANKLIVDHEDKTVTFFGKCGDLTPMMNEGLVVSYVRAINKWFANANEMKTPEEEKMPNEAIYRATVVDQDFRRAPAPITEQ